MILPTWVRVGLVLFGVLMVQLVVINDLAVWGATGSALVTLPVAAGLLGGSIPGALVGFAAGLSIDVFVTTPFGLTALVWTITGYVVGVVGINLLRSSKATIVGLAALSAVASIGAFVLVGAILGQDHLLRARLLPIAIMGALVAAISVLAVLQPMRWAL
ncbi:MAG: hypothetical protein JJE52_05235, partial [Acidimicrobiia bacterium]|nr:hypothetical protein [Acidimicrobiia bacterium]